MTIAYSINGGTEIHGVVSDWQETPIRQEGDGTITYNNWDVNLWTQANMDMVVFEALRALQGTLLNSIETNDIDNRNTGKAYTKVILEGVVNGQQFGIEMRNVSLRFRVDTTS